MILGAFWVLDAAADGGHVDVAPCGDYHRRRRLQLGSHHQALWSRALERPLPELAGVGYLGESIDRPVRVWSTPSTTTHRPLLLALSPPKRPFGAAALEGASGENLASILGTTLSMLLETFEAHNLTPFHDATRADREHHAARFLDGRERGGTAAADRRRPLVVLGRDGVAALAAAAGSPEALERMFLGVFELPHPSGRNPELDVADVRQRVRTVLVSALATSRQSIDSRTCLAAQRVGPRAGIELGRRVVFTPRGHHVTPDPLAEALANIAADGHRPAWVLLRERGVAAGGRRIADGWERVVGGPQQKFERRWHDGRAVVAGPPWRVGFATSDGRWEGFRPSGVDRTQSFLLAEQEARDRDWVDPWQARNRELDFQILETVTPTRCA